MFVGLLCCYVVVWTCSTGALLCFRGSVRFYPYALLQLWHFFAVVVVSDVGFASILSGFIVRMLKAENLFDSCPIQIKENILQVPH